MKITLYIRIWVGHWHRYLEVMVLVEALYSIVFQNLVITAHPRKKIKKKLKTQALK